MKRYTTRFFKAVALGYMAFPFVYLLCGALLFDIPASHIATLLLSPSFYLLCILAVSTGYGLWEVKRWSWYTFLVTNVFIAYANAVLAVHYAESHHKLLAFILSVFGLVLLVHRMGREMRVPYFLPNIRWWETNPRYRLTAPVQMQIHQGLPFAGEILDLSMGGCFVKLKIDVPQHETISLQFSLFGVTVKCDGTVVWCTQGTVTHPRGVGIKFAPLSRHPRRALKAITRRLKKIAVLYRSSRYLLTPEEFSRRLEELQSAQLKVSGQ